jgi:hypothetical protein
MKTSLLSVVAAFVLLASASAASAVGFDHDYNKNNRRTEDTRRISSAKTSGSWLRSAPASRPSAAKTRRKPPSGPALKPSTATTAKTARAVTTATTAAANLPRA